MNYELCRLYYVLGPLSQMFNKKYKSEILNFSLAFCFTLASLHLNYGKLKQAIFFKKGKYYAITATKITNFTNLCKLVISFTNKMSGEFSIDFKTGTELQEDLMRLVDKSWKSGKEFSFKYKEEVMIKLKASPKSVQKGNGVISFLTTSPLLPDRWIPSSWEFLNKHALSKPIFWQYYSKFLKQNMSSWHVHTKWNKKLSSNPFFQACFLLQFEVARRIETSDDFPKRRETREAINIALKGKRTDLLIKMFTATKPGKGSSFNYSGRKEAHGQILKLKDPDVDSLTEAFKKFNSK